MAKSSKIKPRRAADRVTLGSQLREAVRADGRSPFAIAEAAGVSPSIVSRFLSGERPDLLLSTADALCGALGLRLTGVSRRGAGRGSAPSAESGASAD